MVLANQRQLASILDEWLQNTMHIPIGGHEIYTHTKFKWQRFSIVEATRENGLSQSEEMVAILDAQSQNVMHIPVGGH